MKTTLIRNARIWDGTGARAFVGDLLKASAVVQRECP